MPDLALSRRDLLADAAAALTRAGIAEARREALRLWAEIAPGAGGSAGARPRAGRWSPATSAVCRSWSAGGARASRSPTWSAGRAFVGSCSGAIGGP